MLAGLIRGSLCWYGVAGCLAKEAHEVVGVDPVSTTVDLTNRGQSRSSRLTEGFCDLMEQVASAVTAHLASQTPPTLVALLTGGFDRPYAFGLSMALSSRGLYLDVIGSDEVDSPEMHSTPGLNFLNLQGRQKSVVSLAKRILRLLLFYARLCRYATPAETANFPYSVEQQALLHRSDPVDALLQASG